MPRRTRLWVGPVLLGLLDVGLTMAGQPPAYWAGDRLAAHEANPLAAWLLHAHPAAFAVAAAGLLAGYVVLIERLPSSLARVAAFVILFLHALGASSWLARHGLPGLVAAAALLAAASWLVGWSWRGGSR
jgi:hypothetical protein